MVKYVLVIKEDVCSANHKDEATINKLLEKCHEFGDVLKYEDCITSEIYEREQIIGHLKARNEVLEAVNLSDDEKAMLNSYRECKAAAVGEYQSEIEKKDNMFSKLNEKLNLFIKQVEDVCTANKETENK